MQPIDSTLADATARGPARLQSVASPLAPPLFATRQSCVPQPENKIKKKNSGTSKGQIGSSAARGAAGLTAASLGSLHDLFETAR
jgi:hypothetical protein